MYVCRLCVATLPSSDPPRSQPSLAPLLALFLSQWGMGRANLASAGLRRFETSPGPARLEIKTRHQLLAIDLKPKKAIAAGPTLR